MRTMEIQEEIHDDYRTALMRNQAFMALRAAMPPANMEAALKCSARLEAALPHTERLDRNLVMVAYGGGKDSSYTLAFVRAMQLILFRAYGTTFRLRVATNRHAGMPRAVLENVERAYLALQLTTDPDCELLLIDGNEVTPFDVDAPQRADVIRRNRLDILMTGHRTFADGRPTFCNACNLSVFNSFGVAAAHGDGADVIITGDSQQEQRQYTAWVSKLARRLARPPRPPRWPRPPARTAWGACSPTWTGSGSRTSLISTVRTRPMLSPSGGSPRRCRRGCGSSPSTPTPPTAPATTWRC